MKKTAIIGIVVLLVMFFVTCEFFQSEDGVEYTDVVYSEDGSRVTLYLDGVGVPKTAAQRAMSTRLSKMAYDYLDVVFIGGGTIARAQWDLGLSAGISGVYRGPDDTSGFLYDTAASLLVAGLKNGKTLLGIGEIREIDGAVVANNAAKILPTTKSVTYYVTAVKTGLLVDGETITATPGNKYGITVSSFGTFSPATIGTGSTRTKLGNSYVPTYPLVAPTTSAPAPAATAKYTFDGAPFLYKNQIHYVASSATVPTYIFVEPRFPRYMENGRYRQLTATIDMLSTVGATQPADENDAFNNVIELNFVSKGSGIFSFYIEIPVWVLATGVTADKGTNAGELSPIKWKIRTGLGSELYSLDDGAAGGGCVLMTIGKLDLEDWLEIEWEWLP